ERSPVLEQRCNMRTDTLLQASRRVYVAVEIRNLLGIESLEPDIFTHENGVIFGGQVTRQGGFSCRHLAAKKMESRRLVHRDGIRLRDIGGLPVLAGVVHDGGVSAPGRGD